MTPILIVTQMAGQAPHVFWASDAHVVAASARLDDPVPLGFEAAWDRYAARYDKARWFASRDEARLWAESYEGEDWLAIRAEIAKSEPVPPNDVVFEDVAARSARSLIALRKKVPSETHRSTRTEGRNLQAPLLKRR